MRRTILWAAVVALAFTAPALAAPVHLPKAYGVYAKQITAALNKEDPEAVAALYVHDGQFVGPDGRLHTGRAAVAEGYAAAFKFFGKAKFEVRPVELQRIGSDWWAIGHAVVAMERPNGTIPLHMHWMAILVPHGNSMRIRLFNVGPDARPPGPPHRG